MWKTFTNALATEVGSLFNDMDSEFVGRTVTIQNKNVRVVSLLGEGGFAYVYLGELESGQRVALKRFITQTKEMLESVVKEIKVMELLGNSCPNIVGYYGSEHKKITEHKWEILILMELCSGGSLTQCLQGSKQFSEEEVLRMFAQIVMAVGHMHRQKPPIAHRDLKVDNILIAKDGSLKLCDFGSCSTEDRIYSTKREIMHEQAIIDRTTTPSYRAPEIVDLYLRVRVNYKVDIWALGVILYAMAYNKMPFGQDCAKAAILEGNVKIPKSRQPKRMGKLVKVMLHKRPEKRPSCEEILAHCESILAGGDGTMKFKRSKGKSRSSGLSLPKQYESISSPSLSPEPSKELDNSNNSKSKLNQKIDDFNGWDPFHSGEQKSTKLLTGKGKATSTSFGEFEAPAIEDTTNSNNFDDHSWVSGVWAGFDSPEEKTSHRAESNKSFVVPEHLDLMTSFKPNSENVKQPQSTRLPQSSKQLHLLNNRSKHRHSKSADSTISNKSQGRKSTARSPRNSSLNGISKFQFDPLGGVGVELPSVQPPTQKPVEDFDPLN